MACLILALRFLTTGRPLTVAALKVEPELGCPVSLPDTRESSVLSDCKSQMAVSLMLVSWVM